MTARRLGAGFLVLTLAGVFVLWAPPAGEAYVPSAEKIARAVARANQAAGRGEPLWADVTLRIGDAPDPSPAPAEEGVPGADASARAAEPVATGVLASHPTGLARLELRSRRGFVERHLLQGSEYRASRDGQVLSAPHPFLPPLFMLQAGSGEALQAALGSFGVSSAEVELGRIGDVDCYVLGGRIPGRQDVFRGPAALPALWIDMESLRVVRIDRVDGSRLNFGPEVSFENIRIPSWIEIQLPGGQNARLEIKRVARASAPAAAFGMDWLQGSAATEP